MVIVAEHKNSRNMHNFQFVTDHRRVETSFLFQEFRFKRSKILLHLILFLAVESYHEITFECFCFWSFAHKFFAYLALRS